MESKAASILRKGLEPEHLDRLLSIDSPRLHGIVARYMAHCCPDRVFIATDGATDREEIRRAGLRDGEEAPLKAEGHTVHFDGYRDQARDRENTKYLVGDPDYFGPEINTIPRDDGLREIHSLMEGIMRGHTMYVRFFSLGPPGSVFSIPCLQITDSGYVAHTEDLLYRHGYGQFADSAPEHGFFTFVHSRGATMPAGLGLKVSRDVEKRRIYIDLKSETVFSINTQYGGNTLGMKKLAMRLAINRASRENWLTEHMLVMGVTSPRGDRMYFTGAFPSMCGKTSTAMMPGETIIGDDIAFLRSVGGQVRAVNMETGMFGIIQGVNPEDNPIIWKVLHTPGRQIIFSNVLVKPDRTVFWNDNGEECPEEGVNHSGDWHREKTDGEGKSIPASHKNARFALNLEYLSNADPKLHDPEGVKVDAMIYGGRDSDTWVPVEEAFNWEHGIITKGGCLESETTAATLGARGIRTFNPMSNLDFLSVPVGTYLRMNLEFGRGLASPPKIFGVNYFLKDMAGKYLNQKRDKRVWLKWVALRVEDAVDVVRTPTGLIPKYDDLRELFMEMLQKEYTEEHYVKQFTFRVPQQLTKLHRIGRIYKTRVRNTPPEVLTMLEQQVDRIEEARRRFGNYISPFELISQKKDYRWPLSPRYDEHV